MTTSETQSQGTSAMSILVGIYARIGALETAGDEYLDRFQEDLEKVVDRLKKLSDDLKSSFHICPQISQRLLSKQSTEEYFVLLENDHDLREKTRNKLELLGASLDEIERVLGYFPKVVEKRNSFERVRNLEKRRSIKSVFDKCRRIESELLEWKKSARRTLQKIAASGVPQKLGIQLPGQEEPSQSKKSGARASRSKGESGVSRPKAERPSAPKSDPRRPRAKSEKAGRSRGGRKARARSEPATREASGVHQSRESSAAQAQSKGTGTTAEPASKPRDRELELAQRKLRRWARWFPFVPSRAGKSVKTSLTTHSDAKVFHVKALWGERSVTRKTSPYRGGTVDDKPVHSLWDLPSTPPQGFREGKEHSFRVPGNDAVVECRECASESGSSGCPACDGAGRVLNYEVCDTRYRVDSFVESTSDRSLPEKLVTSQGRQVFQDYVFFPPGKDGQQEYEKKCLEAISREAGTEVTKALEQRFLNETARRPSLERQRQLIRVGIEIATVPVWEYLCEARAPGGKDTWRFKVWLYGDDRKFHAGGFPRRFTWKATAWCLGATLLGVPVGYLLMLFLSAP